MHWSRWGDPAQAGPLSESTRALVDAFIGTREAPAVEPGDVELSEPLDAVPAGASPFAFRTRGPWD